MDSIGLDLHKRESQLCILTAAGEVLEQRIVTSGAWSGLGESRVPTKMPTVAGGREAS